MPRVIASTASVGVVISLVIAKISSDLLGAASWFCLFPCLLVLNVVIIRLVRRYCYRPPENHMGVVYRLGRFHRLVTPDQWVVLLPFIDRIHREVSLYMRTAELQLRRVELLDGLAVDVWLKIFFKVDLRLVNPENFVQVMKFEGVEWTEMVKTSAEDVIRNQIFLDSTYPEMANLRKSREIKQRLSQEIANRMKGFGIIINETHGVMPINFQPNSTYFEAVQASRAAAPLGEAALGRLRPVLAALNQIEHEDARTVFLLDLASKIVEVENLPDIVMEAHERHPSRTGQSDGRVIREDVDGYPRQIKPKNRKYPLAG